MANEVEIIVTAKDRNAKSTFRDIEGDAKKSFSKLGKDSGESFGDLFKSSANMSLRGFATSPAGIAIGASLAAAVLPAMGAAVAAGAALGMAGGTLTLGIVRAVKDPRVSEAWEGQWDAAGKALDARAGSLVQPLVDAAASIGTSVQQNAIPKIGDAFDKLAPRVREIGTGMASAIANIFSGDAFDRVIGLGDRLLGKLASELPNFGNAINDFLGSIADAGPGAEAFFDDILSGTQHLVVGLGNVVEGLSKTYKAMDDFGTAVNSGLDQASVAVGTFAENVNTAIGENVNKTLDEALVKGQTFGHDFNEAVGGNVNKTLDEIFGINREEEPPAARSLNILGQAARDSGGLAIQASEDYAALTTQLNQVAATADTVYGGLVDRVMNTIMGLDQATLGFAESQTHLSESINQNGLALDIHTAKGQRNREAILSVVSANQQEFDAMIKSGAGADAAASAYNSNTAALEHQMRQAGFTQAQIDGLIGKYRSVPADVSTAIELHGLAATIAGLSDVIAKAYGIPTRRDIYITQHLATVGGFSYKSPDRVQELAGALAHGGITGAAGGGPRSRWTWVGEQGRELVKLPPGSHVMPHGQSENMAAASGGGGGGMELYWKSTGDRLLDTIIQGIGVRIRTDQATSDLFASAGQ